MRNLGAIGFTSLIILSVQLQNCTEVQVETAAAGPPWVKFNTSNSKLPGNYVNAIFDDSEDKVWIATYQGVSYYRRGTWNSMGSQLNGTVKSITQGADGSLWFAGAGIRRYNQYTRSVPWVSYPVGALAVASELARGQIWCAGLGGASCFIPSTDGGGLWVQYTTDNSPLPTNMLRSVAVDVFDNSVWFGTQYSGTIYIDGEGNWQRTISLPDPFNVPIVAIAFDGRNTGWFAKWQGVSSLNLRTYEWHHYTNDNTNGDLPYGNVNAVTTDLNVTRWFGTYAGLVRLRDTTWTTFSRLKTPELPSDSITALTYDKRGNLWIGTPNGVAVFNEAGVRL